jgi:dolichyl-phosphate beta-glucosyltransferase
LRLLSIVIPAYNEEARLPSTLEAIATYLRTKNFPAVEVIVVDDGSRDGTAALVERTPNVRLLKNPGNRGKGYAVRHGMLEAKGDWILYSDADLSAPIEELDKLLAAAEAQKVDIAIGSRAVDRSLVGVHQNAIREFSGRVFNVVMRVATGIPFRDTQCGFKLFRGSAAREVFSRQVLDGFSFDVEDLMIAKTLGLRAIEVPVVWNNVEGTKVSPISGIKSFSDLVGIRWRASTGGYR